VEFFAAEEALQKTPLVTKWFALKYNQTFQWRAKNIEAIHA